MSIRTDLIEQLRHALYLCESPNDNVIEIGNTSFCFEDVDNPENKFIPNLGWNNDD